MFWKRRGPAPAPAPAPSPAAGYPEWLSYEPALIPPVERIRQEAVPCVEEWFRWAEEWSMILRVYGRLRRGDAVLEIGCGIGRIAFALRYLLAGGSYDGFDIIADKIAFMQERFTPAHPNFRFVHANVRNTYYNPGGTLDAHTYRFPYASDSMDLVFAASVYTHMVPENTRRYVHETGRVLRPGGRCVLSAFLLDHYRPGAPRPSIFAHRDFAFDTPYGDWGRDFAVGDPADPEHMTAYRLALLERFAEEAGLRLAQPPVPGMWSGGFEGWVSPQDLVVLEKPEQR
jgi:SAM-dependent methyltransferase